MHRRSLIRLAPWAIAGGLLARGLSSIEPALAQSRQTRTRRVQFAPGRSSATFTDAVPLGNTHIYVLRVRRGQRVTTDLRWVGEALEEQEQGLSGLSWQFPGQAIVEDVQQDRFDAPTTGDYRVIVAQPYRLTSDRYRLVLTVV